MHTSGEHAAVGCPTSVLELVARFDLHSETYKQQSYNETQVRREFIDPLFAALGWDIDNEGGHAEAYKDVIHEDALKIGGSTEAPDYCRRQIATTDTKIDRLTHELYERTDEETHFVEDATA